MGILQVQLLLVPFLTSSLGAAQYLMQDAALMNYMDRRFLSLEKRLEKCNQDILDYVDEFRDFSKMVLLRLARLNSYKAEVKSEVLNLLTRIEQAQRDIDYFGSVTDSNLCIEVHEDLVKQQLLEEAEEKKKLKLMLNANILTAYQINSLEAAFYYKVTENPPKIRISEYCSYNKELMVAFVFWSGQGSKSQLKSCDHMLASIKSLKIVKKTGDKHGSWMKDPGKKHTKIYLLNDSVNNVILEFANIMTFMENNQTLSARRVTLPFPWEGTGHVIYQGFLFYHRYGSLNEITKFNIQSRKVADQMLLPGAGRIPAYQLSPHTKIDLAIDEQGLWAIHAEPETGGNIVITKINHITMAVEHTWDTLCSSKDAEAAFMACKTLYVVYNSPSRGTSRIQCVYDALDVVNSYEIPALHFPKRQGSHSTIHYNPKEKQLFAWGDGSQIIYKLHTQQKVYNF